MTKDELSKANELVNQVKQKAMERIDEGYEFPLYSVSGDTMNAVRSIVGDYANRSEFYNNKFFEYIMDHAIADLTKLFPDEGFVKIAMTKTDPKPNHTKPGLITRLKKFFRA